VLRHWGRHAEARDQLTAAVEVLQADPDTDTVRAMAELAGVAVFAGAPDAGKLSAEALTLGQALGVDAGQFVVLFVLRGIYLSTNGKRREAVAYYREAARLADDTGDYIALGRALLNLADDLTITDPAAAAEAARTAAGHLRRAGNWDYLSYAITNLAQALLMLGDWDTAEEELNQAADSSGQADRGQIACYRAWLAALRGDTATSEKIMAGLRDLRGSEDPQEKALVSIVEAFAAAARGQPKDALRHARETLARAAALGISFEYLRWAWPLAARATFDLGDIASTRELLILFDDSPPGHLAPMQKAERDLVRARLATSDGDQDATASFATAISRLREHSTPYHLAHGLLDHAQHLTHLGDTDVAEAAIAEARGIAERLRCQPLLDRAADLIPARPPVQT